MRSNDQNIPNSAGYVNKGKDRMNTGWGIAKSGVMIFNGISGEGVDPFYPSIYGSVTDLNKAQEKVDRCLAHP